MGAYCPQGSYSPILCQAGYYLNSTRNDEVTDCLICTPGYYCTGSGNIIPDGICTAGWYCPGGQEDPMPYGYNCTLGKLYNLHTYHSCFSIYVNNCLFLIIMYDISAICSFSLRNSVIY